MDKIRTLEEELKETKYNLGKNITDQQNTIEVENLKLEIEKLKVNKKCLVKEQKEEILTLLEQIEILKSENGKLSKEINEINEFGKSELKSLPKNEQVLRNKENEVASLRRLLNASKEKELKMLEKLKELEDKLKQKMEQSRQTSVKKSSYNFLRKENNKSVKNIDSSQKSVKTVSSGDNSLIKKKPFMTRHSPGSRLLTSASNAKNLPPKMFVVSKKTCVSLKKGFATKKTQANVFEHKKKSIRDFDFLGKKKKRSFSRDFSNESEFLKEAKLAVLKESQKIKNDTPIFQINELKSKSIAQLKMMEINERLRKLKEMEEDFYKDC